MITEEARSVLETLARSFTDFDDLTVTWGDTPCTDFKKIYLRKEKTIVPGVECTPGELWLSQKATTAHESAHLLFTDEKAWKAFCNSSLEAHILNIVEDARVERAMANLFPGVLRWFRFTNEYIFVNRKNWTSLPPQDQALYELCSYAVVGRIHDGPSEREKRFIQECVSYVDQGRISKTTEDAAKEAAKIVEIYKKYYGELPTLPKPKIIFSPKPMPALDGKSDPRREPIKFKDVKKDTHTPEDKPKDREENPEPKDLPEDKVIENSQPIEECPTIDNIEEKSDTEPSYDEFSHDSSESRCDEEEPDCAEDESSETGEPVETPGADEPTADETDEYGTPGKTDEPEDVPTEPDELLSGIDDLLEKNEKEVAKLSLPDETIEEERIEITKDDMKDKFSLDLHFNRKLLFEKTRSYPEEKASIEKGIHSITERTINEIRKILESRSGGKRRCIPKGWLDRSILWKVAVKEPNIFMRKNAPSNNPDLAVYLLIDCSGSMEIPVSKRCCTRLHCAAEAGILLHRVCKNLNIPHAATGFTTEDFSDGHAKHYKLKEFHEREARIEAILKEVYCSDNVDGFSIRAAAAELLCRPELNKILFVISDGLPEAVEYRSGEAVKDTVKAVREVISYGIGVIGIFIGDERQSMYAKEIYPHLIFLDAGDLPIILAKTLKIVITNPA
jgi:hypothetical protein